MLKRLFDWLFKDIPERPNETIEMLKEQVTYLRYQNEQLLKGILETSKDEMQPANIRSIDHEVDNEPIQPKIIPWHVRKQMLESEDRQKAKLMKEAADNRKQAIEELEGRLKVNPLDLSGDLNVQSKPVEANVGDDFKEEEQGQKADVR